MFKGSLRLRVTVESAAVRQGDIVDNVEVRSFFNRFHAVPKGRTYDLLSDNVSAWKGIKAHKVSLKNRDKPQSFACLLKSLLFLHHNLIGIRAVNDSLVAAYPCDRKKPGEGMASWRHIAQGFWEPTLAGLSSSLFLLLACCVVCSFKKPHSFCYLRKDKRKQMNSISSNSQSPTYLNSKEIIMPDLGYKDFLIYTNASFLYSFRYGMRHHLYHLGRLCQRARGACSGLST